MIPMTLREITDAVGGSFHGDAALFEATVADIVIDSRLATAGALYIPIKGERFDGHDFIDAAIDNGALCVLSARALDNRPYILVSDTLLALQQVAGHYRDKFDIPVVGITGSVGKTSTKEMIASVLSSKFSVLKNVGSFNNQTGVPLTLLRLDEAHEVAVVEMGTNHFGEIAALTKIVKPLLCVFTNIGVAHIEFFGSREGILQGKCEMLAGMQSGGSVIVNGDDDMLVRIPDAMRFGFGEGCELRATNVIDRGLDGMTFDAIWHDESVHVNVPSPGRHSVSNALAAMAVGLKLGMHLKELAEGVEAFAAPAGRMNIRRTDTLTVLDDSYNANPNSVMAAIDVLEKVQGRRVCVLGDMLELGAQSDEFHEVAGMYAAIHGIDLIVCVGPNSEQTFMGAHALAPSRARYFETQETLLDILPLLVRDHDTILVKASRGMHLEKTVEMLVRR